MKINFRRGIKVVSPVMIVGWPGMGNVALNAVDYIRGKLGARLFAELDTGGAYLPDSVIVDKGIAKIPETPKNLFFYRKNPPIIFLEGQVQFSGMAGSNLMNEILDLAEKFKVRRIITGAAFPASVSYSQRSKVYVAANRVSLLRYFTSRGLRTLNAGQISGLNGLMLGFAQAREIEAACLLATVPQYAVSLPNPRASRAIVEVICSILGITVDFEEMDEVIKEMDGKMAAIEDKMKELFPGSEPQHTIDTGSSKIPSYVMEKIERLFKEAKKEREKAYQLKQELDRWDLYEFYEDRFLDIFKDSK